MCTDLGQDSPKNTFDSVNMYGLLTKFVRSRWKDIGQVLFCVFMDRDEVEVHNLAKKERGLYPAILTEQTWSIKDLLYGFQGNFSILPARVANHIA